MPKSVEIVCEVTGSVWKVMAQPGQQVAAGDVLLVVESMKMEIPVESPCAGELHALACGEGQPVREGETLGWVTAP